VLDTILLQNRAPVVRHHCCPSERISMTVMKTSELQSRSHSECIQCVYAVRMFLVVCVCHGVCKFVTVIMCVC